MEGVRKGLQMLADTVELGIEEVSLYGFTQDNVKRPREQREAFSRACCWFAEEADRFDIQLLVVGDTSSPAFPAPLLPLAQRRTPGSGPKVNMLVNYGWEWDLRAARGSGGRIAEGLASAQVSRIDLVVRWGGCRRLSGFLPVQCVYADFYVIDAYWPDYELPQFLEALEWYQTQEATLGG